jgi:tetratricopeptide (TPR) repeat protein
MDESLITNPVDITALTRDLQQILKRVDDPPSQDIQVLVDTIIDFIKGKIDQDDVNHRAMNDTIFATLLQHLAGKFLYIDPYTINFNDTTIYNSNLSIGNIIGGNLIQVQLTMASQPLPASVVLPPPSPMLPPLPIHFVSRDIELETYKTQLTEQRTLLITGMPGVGKTTMAALLAYHTTQPRNIFWHSFHTDETVQTLIWELAAFLAWHNQVELWNLLHYLQKDEAKMPPADVLMKYIVQGLVQDHYVFCFDNFQIVDHDLLIIQLVKLLYQQSILGTCFLIITSNRSIQSLLSVIPTRVLQGLSPDDIRRLLERHAFLDVSSNTIATLHQITEGNSELVSLVVNTMKQTDAWDDLLQDLTTTQAVERFLLERVDAQLLDEERAVMQALALLVYPSTRDAIEATLNRDIPRGLLYDLTDRALITPNGSVTDRTYTQHILLQTFYTNISWRKQRTRQAMHRRAGKYYAVAASDSLRAGYHYLEAGNQQRAVSLLTGDVWVMINKGQAQSLNNLLGRITMQQVSTEQWIHIITTRGQIAMDLSQYDTAQDHFEMALTLLRQGDFAHTYPQQARIYGMMSVILRYSDPEKALEFLNNALANQIGLTDLERGILHFRKGDVFTSKGAYEEAVNELTESLRKLPTDALLWRAGVLTDLGITYCARGNTQEGIEYYNEALSICQTIGNQWVMVDLYQNMGFACEIKGDWHSATIHYHRALRLAEQLDRVDRQITLHLSLAILSTNKGADHDAAEHFQTALTIARSVQRHDLELPILSSFVDFYIRIKQWDTADQIFVEATALLPKLGIDTHTPELYRSHSQLVFARNQHEEALEYAQRALDIAQDLESSSEEGLSYRVVGQIFSALSKSEEAILYFERSTELLKDYDPYEVARTQLVWGECMIGYGYDNAGTDLLKAAETVFSQLGAQRDLAILHAILAKHDLSLD